MQFNPRRLVAIWRRRNSPSAAAAADRHTAKFKKFIIENKMTQEKKLAF
jgi:hypothetical protein